MSKGPKSGNAAGINTSSSPFNTGNASPIKLIPPNQNGIGNLFNGPSTSGRGSLWIMELVK